MTSQKTDSDLVVLQLNIRGLINKQTDLHKLLSNGSTNKVDVVLLCETWLRKETNKLINIPNYQFVGKERQGKKGGGVGILISNDLKYRHRDDLDSTNDDFEHITIELKGDKKQALIMSCYRAPNTNVNQFLESYQRLTDKCMTEHRNNYSIIGLDHNLDLLKSNEHRATQSFIENNLNNRLLPCISKPTRLTHTSATLIDNIFCSEELYRNCKSYILVEDLSDHLPCISVYLDFFPTKQTEQILYKRNLTEKNIAEIVTDLDSVNWDVILHQNTSEQQFNKLHETLVSALDKHAPIRPKKTKKAKLCEPWLTKGLLKCQRKQKILFKKTIAVFGKSVTTENVEKYKKYLAILQRCKRASKQNYYYLQCTELKKNMKKLWDIINKMINKKTNKMHVIDCLTKENIKITNSREITEEFGKYFASVGKTYATKIENPKTNIGDYTNKIPNQEKTLYMYPTNESEIERIIRELPNKTSSGHDDISNNLLKKIGPCISKALCKVFNNSLSEGTFPTIMKQADVVPLFKSKSREFTTNYRPISLLMTISKVLEKIVYKRTYKFLENTKQIYRSQYGFRSKHSCEQAVGEFLSEVIKNNEQGKDTIAVYLDLSKAFDTLNHSLLLRKLERYGIRGLSLKWYESYLKGRTLCAKCNTAGGIVYSSQYEIEYGTPQGSCLGPLLFLIFTNDLHLHLIHCKCILFADDTTLYISHDKGTYMEWCVSEDLLVLKRLVPGKPTDT